MNTFHWTYLVPVIVALIIGFSLVADADTSRPENVSTRKLRVLLLIFGTSLFYTGFLIWHFDLEWGVVRQPKADIYAIALMLMGFVVSVAGFARSRENLIKDSRYLTDDPADIEIPDRPIVSAAARVRNASERNAGQ